MKDQSRKNMTVRQFAKKYCKGNIGVAVAAYWLKNKVLPPEAADFSHNDWGSVHSQSGHVNKIRYYQLTERKMLESAQTFKEFISIFRDETLGSNRTYNVALRKAHQLAQSLEERLELVAYIVRDVNNLALVGGTVKRQNQGKAILQQSTNRLKRLLEEIFKAENQQGYSFKEWLYIQRACEKLSGNNRLKSMRKAIREKVKIIDKVFKNETPGNLDSMVWVYDHFPSRRKSMRPDIKSLLRVAIEKADSVPALFKILGHYSSILSETGLKDEVRERIMSITETQRDWAMVWDKIGDHKMRAIALSHLSSVLSVVS